MSVDVGTVILSGALPLLGVLSGAGATISVQRSSTQTSRLRFVAESQQAHRAEIKSSLIAYLEIVQQLQTNLDAREHGEEVSDLRKPMEQVWLAYKQSAIICSEQLQSPLLEHTQALHTAVRDRDNPDWWASVLPVQDQLLDAMRIELSPSHDWEQYRRRRMAED